MTGAKGDHGVHDEASAVARILELTDGGNGDDAAILRPGASPVCVSTDSTIAGVHAPAGTSPHALGRRAAARALSDLAAMGAAPLAMTCAVHVPAGGWGDAVALVEGVVERGERQRAPLVGGDLCRTAGSALAATVTVIGRRAGARRDGFVSRAGARARDELFVTGALGAASAALARGDAALPEPPDRIRAGIALAPFAAAMIDLSDGLARDVRTLARCSRVDARVDLDRVPLAPDVTDPVAAATGGDDYELLLAISPERVAAARAALAAVDSTVSLTCIGRVVDGTGVATFTRGGADIAVSAGFTHE
ncbi:MAG: thiamine-monophosphate kinase [Thermoleophilia bacterium]|nr:thiamine-monophosphate kinase [Thermoleophilia bacterium]